ncbi:hypothetical protein BDZ97DRAFT_625499 [Flammula alnicola]|nr:hypothetical protein BDZ97DRAFT_625499 [Flammula alnicola]
MVERRVNGGKTMPIILFVSTISQFLLSTAYTAMGLRMLIDSFISLGDSPEAILAYWLSPSNRLQVASKAIYLTNSLIGDAILVWRLYVVWGNNWYICVVPVIMVIATTGTSYATVADLANLSSLQTLFRAGNTILAAWALSIATQFSVSCAIAGRIMWISRGVPSLASHRYFSVIWIIVESGAIYCITTVLLLTFFDLKTQAGGIIGGVLAQICAIVPTLIIVRVGLRRSYEPTTITSYGSRKPGRAALPMSMEDSRTAGIVEVGLVHRKDSGTLSTPSKSTRVHTDVESWDTRTENE